MMSKAGVLDLAAGIGGTIDKSEVLSAIDNYEKYHVCYGGEEEERKANYSDMVNKYYDQVTSFYECGWGESFHFARRWKGESQQESMKRHEHFLASQLALKPGYKVDIMHMPFSDNTFDAVYAIEATCHAPNVYGCCKEIYRVLKPGQYFAAYEWCMTDSFDPHNKENPDIKAEIEIGNGLPDIQLTGQCIEALKQAGFEVKSLECVGQAPEGSLRVLNVLERAVEGLVKGGSRQDRNFYPDVLLLGSEASM